MRGEQSQVLAEAIQRVHLRHRGTLRATLSMSELKPTILGAKLSTQGATLIPRALGYEPSRVPVGLQAHGGGTRA